jgi:polyferredoxin
MDNKNSDKAVDHSHHDMTDHSQHDMSESNTEMETTADPHEGMDHGSQSMHSSHMMHGGMNYAEFSGTVLILLFAVLYYGFRKNVLPAKNAKKFRIDLLAFPGIERMIRWKYFSISLRSVSALIFSFIVLTGLVGNPHTSIAASFTWLIWWTLLIFFIAFGGKIYCAACPWDFFADLFQFGLSKSVHGEKKSLQKKWPKFMRNIYPATILFIIITWLELGFHLTSDSYLTSILGVMVVGAVVLSSQIFERRSFCRFACPIGRISGVYAQTSPIEMRVRKKEVCQTCSGMECVRGGDNGTKCPTFQLPYKLNQNTYCTLCTECVRACPEQNLTLYARPLNEDLKKVRQTRMDEGLLVIVVIILTFFHGLTMTPTWLNWTNAVGQVLNVDYLFSFTLLMITLMVGTFLLLSATDKVIRMIFKIKGFSLVHLFAFIPLVLGYHLGHNAMHLLAEGTRLIPMIGDPFGWGWNWMGLSDYVPAPLMSHGALHYLQLAFILIGFMFSSKVLRIRIQQSSQIVESYKKLYFSYGSVLFLLGVLAVWFVYQPMVMRVGM